MNCCFSRDGCWHQHRADREKGIWDTKLQMVHEKASAAVRARWNKPDASSNSGALLEHSPSSSSSPKTQKTGTSAQSVPTDELAGTLPLVDGTECKISRKQIDEWSEACPADDVELELRKLKAWLNANPKRRKTRNGIARAIVNWLSRAQDKPSPVGGLNGNRHNDGRQC